MKYFLYLVTLFLLASPVNAADKCLCGPYRYAHAFPGNSTNHYRLMDGAVNAAIVRDTERTADRKYLRTEIFIEWPGNSGYYSPAYDQLANDADKICVKGEVKTANAVNAKGGSESLTYFESVENIFPFASECEGAPISIHIDAVKKAELPH